MAAIAGRRAGVFLGAAEVAEAEAAGRELCRMEGCTFDGVVYDVIGWEPGCDPFAVLGPRAARRTRSAGHGRTEPKRRGRVGMYLKREVTVRRRGG